MPMALKIKKNDAPFCQKVNFFPGWLAENEEKYLEKMAQKGWMLEDIHKDSVYYFRRAESQNAVYAVEFLGRNPSIAEDIAADCNAGWEFIGTFGKKRYYRASSPAPAHPSADSEFEQARLSTSVTNLTTLFLLNIPGTLYCLLYTVLLLLTDGLTMIGLFSYQFIYLFGAVLGIFSMIVFLRWALSTRKRIKKLGVR